MNSEWDFSQERWLHKLTIRNIGQWANDIESDNFFVYNATIPKGETSVYMHTLDSITRLMHNADSTSRSFPTRNKQLVMKYYYYLMSVEPLDSLQFTELVNGILYRRDELKRKDASRWKQRIEDLNTLHTDIKDLYLGCSTFSYPNEFDHEKDPVAHLYFDQRNSTFIKLTYTTDATTHLLFRPTHYHLLTRNEEMKEHCSCCSFF